MAFAAHITVKHLLWLPLVAAAVCALPSDHSTANTPTTVMPTTSCVGTIVNATCQEAAPLLRTLDCADADACCAACAADGRCAAWNTNAAQGQCHLRYEFVPNDGDCVSGVVRETPSGPAQRAPPAGANSPLVMSLFSITSCSWFGSHVVTRHVILYQMRRTCS